MTTSDDLTALVKTVMQLSKIDWFKKSVRDIRGFKVESWSNFTDLVKNSWDIPSYAIVCMFTLLDLGQL